ncbi:MAG: Cys-Gln thioester bond-forming surface protein [Bacilli bacterium]|nr:Cys-Gln thioester bond-forming surface protein [Bacilli bacterium]
MRKIKYLIITLMVLLGILCVDTLNVEAAPSNIKMKSKSSLYYFSESKGTDYISGYNFYRKELTDGTLVYCISNIDTSVPGGKTLSLTGEIKDKGLAYIIENGYPKKTFTGDNKKDYYITQSAIWEYFDETKGSNNWGKTSFSSSSTGMKKHVYNLVQAAKKASKSTTSNDKVNLILTNTKMALNSDGSYYVSYPIRVSTTLGNSVTISLKNTSDKSFVEGTDGTKKTKFKSGEEFRVYVPNDNSSLKNVEVVATATNEIVKAYRYSTGKSSYQDIGYLVKTKDTITSKLTLNYEQLETKLKISKQDITSKKELAGAVLVIKDSNNNVIETWVSGNEPHYIEGLKAGNYTLTETIAPDGYKLSSETINFTLKANGEVQTVVMYNSKEEVKTTKVKISKQDITSKEEVAGASLVIKDSTGKVVESWVSGSSPHYVEGLAEGNYTLTETVAPTGYKLSSDTINFTVKADGNITSVVMYNEKYSVPITDLDVNTSVIIGALALMLLGSGLVFYAKRSH